MIQDRFQNVWDALEKTPAKAAHMKARSELMIAIRMMVDDWSVTQTQAAKRLGITQPRMNNLLRGRIDKFSLDALMTLASSAGLIVEWRIIKPAA